MENSEIKKQIWHEILSHGAERGWGNVAWKSALDRLGHPPHFAKAYFPLGLKSLIAYGHQLHTDKMVLDIQTMRAKGIGKGLAIKKAIVQHFEQEGAWRFSYRRLIQTQFLRLGLGTGLTQALNLSDALWQAAGDDSYDSSYYTKRAILATILLTAHSVWLEDKHDGADTNAYLEEAFAAVQTIPQRKQAFLAKWENLQDKGRGWGVVLPDSPFLWFKQKRTSQHDYGNLVMRGG